VRPGVYTVLGLGTQDYERFSTHCQILRSPVTKIKLRYLSAVYKASKTLYLYLLSYHFSPSLSLYPHMCACTSQLNHTSLNTCLQFMGVHVKSRDKSMRCVSASHSQSWAGHCTTNTHFRAVWLYVYYIWNILLSAKVFIVILVHVNHFNVTLSIGIISDSISDLFKNWLVFHLRGFTGLSGDCCSTRLLTNIGSLYASYPFQAQLILFHLVKWQVY
jgi:hypothetical protein